MAFPDSFATARLRAERLRPDHLDDLCRMDTSPGFTAMLGGLRSAEQTTTYLARNLQHWDDHGFGLWVLRDGQDGHAVGRAVLRRLVIDGQDEVEVGYGFLPECWGRGLATEIAKACVRFGREALRFPSIVGLTLPANTGSNGS